MSTVIRRESSSAVGTTATAVGSYTAPSVTTGVVVSGLVLANRLTSGATILASAYIQNGASVYYLVLNAVILGGGSLTLFDEGARMALANGDQVFVVSNTALSLDANMMVSEIT